MRREGCKSYLLAVFVAATITAGCSGGSPSSGLGYTGIDGVQSGGHRLARRSTPFMGLRAIVPHRDQSKSWISAKLKADSSGRTLWASDYGTGDVYIFSLPSLALMATITGFSGPQGLCSDGSGDVWVTNTFTNQIFEYSHGGILKNTLADPGGYPASCAWDKKTGNLAVANIFTYNTSFVAGNVLVYPGASGTPVSYTDPGMYYYYFVGYDNRSDLFVDGTDESGSEFVLGELPNNFQSAFSISLSGGTIYSPGFVQWYSAGRYLLVGDQDCSGVSSPETSCVDRVAVSGSSGTITGTTSLMNSAGTAACDVVQAVQNGDKLYGADYEFAATGDLSCTSDSASSAWYRWGYPGGGLPQKSSVPFSSASAPDGVAISK